MTGRDWRKRELDPALHQLNRRPRPLILHLLISGSGAFCQSSQLMSEDATMF